MPNFSSLAGLEVAEKFLWGVGGVVCTVIFMSNPTVVLCCVGVGVLTIYCWDANEDSYMEIPQKKT